MHGASQPSNSPRNEADPTSSQDADGDAVRPRTARLVATVAAFALAATVEWGLAVVSMGDISVAKAAVGWTLFVSLWALSGALVAVAGGTALEAAFGQTAEYNLGRRLVRGIRTLHTDRGTPEDHRRLARWLGALVGLLLFAALSIAWIAHLVANRNGPVLIAIASFVGQLGLAGGAALAARMLRRGIALVLLKFRDQVGTPRGLSTFWTLVAFGVVGAGGLLFLLARYWDVVQAIDGVALLLVAGALLASPVATFALLSRRVRPNAVAWAIPFIALGVFWASAHDSLARALLHRHGHTTSHLYSTIAKTSDLDGDGAASFPIALDCAPLDPSVHPNAKEVPDNGIDENCDGRDDIPSLEQPERPEFEREERPRPNLVLVTLDATRADHLGYMGYDRPTTPNLDRFAFQSVVFERAFSQDSGTAPSFWSLFTGKTPFQVGLEKAHKFPPQIAESERLLAEVLSEEGYHTEALPCGGMFENERWDIRRGFEQWRSACEKQNEKPAPEVTKRALSTLKRLRDRQPFFLWIHYYDPHHPYDDHSLHDFGDEEIDRYDEELRFTDHHLEPLLQAFRDYDADRPLFVAIGADHGENFGEHGTDPHARTLYKEVTHIPFLLWGSPLQPRRVRAPVALNDLYPTFLELARIDIPEQTTMVSQVPVLFGGKPDSNRLVFQENSYSRPRHHRKGIVGSRYHYIKDQTADTEELYDYEKDPEEQVNLIAEKTEVAERMRRTLRRFLQTTTIPEGLQD